MDTIEIKSNNLLFRIDIAEDKSFNVTYLGTTDKNYLSSTIPLVSFSEDEYRYEDKAKYICHVMQKNKYGKILTVVSTDKTYEVYTYIQFYDSIDGFNIYHVIRNGSLVEHIVEYHPIFASNSEAIVESSPIIKHLINVGDEYETDRSIVALHDKKDIEVIKTKI